MRSADPRFDFAAPVVAPSGSTRCRSVACSSGVAFRQISTSPAMLNTCGHAQLMKTPLLNAPATSSSRMSSDASPIASLMPPASDLALL
jgi:hypothetical protein